MSRSDLGVLCLPLELAPRGREVTEVVPPRKPGLEQFLVLGVERRVLPKERGLPISGARRHHEVVLVDERIHPHGETRQLLNAGRSERHDEVVPGLDPRGLGRSEIQPQSVAELRIRLDREMLHKVPFRGRPVVHREMRD